jgi:hypothetical protein
LSNLRARHDINVEVTDGRALIGRTWHLENIGPTPVRLDQVELYVEATSENISDLNCCDGRGLALPTWRSPSSPGKTCVNTGFTVTLDPGGRISVHLNFLDADYWRRVEGINGWVVTEYFEHHAWQLAGIVVEDPVEYRFELKLPDPRARRWFVRDYTSNWNVGAVGGVTLRRDGSTTIAEAKCSLRDGARSDDFTVISQVSGNRVVRGIIGAVFAAITAGVRAFLT